jgi:3-oxoacyl-[acyl-carrier protein] reductase
LHATDRLLERGTTGRTGSPADFGKVVAFLCSEPANFVNGIAMGVDGGAVVGLL